MLLVRVFMKLFLPAYAFHARLLPLALTHAHDSDGTPVSTER